MKYILVNMSLNTIFLCLKNMYTYLTTFYKYLWFSIPGQSKGVSERKKLGTRD